MLFRSADARPRALTPTRDTALSAGLASRLRPRTEPHPGSVPPRLLLPPLCPDAQRPRTRPLSPLASPAAVSGARAPAAATPAHCPGDGRDRRRRCNLHCHGVSDTTADPHPPRHPTDCIAGGGCALFPSRNGAALHPPAPATPLKPPPHHPNPLAGASMVPS